MLMLIKFYLNHPWGRGVVASCFEEDRIRPLVSMVTDTFHRVILGFFYPILFIIAGNEDIHKILDELVPKG